MNSIAIGYKWLSEDFMGIMFHTIQKKGYVIIAQKYLFHQAWAAPSGDCRGGRRSPQGIPVRRPTNRHCLAWNSNFGKSPRWENRPRKKNWLAQVKSIQRLQLRLWLHCFSWCQYYDMYIMIDQDILISLGELAGGVESSPRVPADAWPLPFARPYRWPRLDNWWAREAQ